MNYWEYADYASEINMLVDMIARIPEDKPAKKMALENRLTKAREKIEGIPVPERPLVDPRAHRPLTLRVTETGTGRQGRQAMTVTEEQAEQAQALILDCLNEHLSFQVPFQQVWARPALDLDDVPSLLVWAIYKADPQSLDIPLLNSFGPYIMEEMRNIGIEAIPSISYIPDSEADQLGEPRNRQN